MRSGQEGFGGGFEGHLGAYAKGFSYISLIFVKVNYV